jgi:hypothetical protein
VKIKFPVPLERARDVVGKAASAHHCVHRFAHGGTAGRRRLDLLTPNIRELAVAKQNEWLDARAGGYEPKADRDRHGDSPYLLKKILVAKQGRLLAAPTRCGAAALAAKLGQVQDKRRLPRRRGVLVAVFGARGKHA